ncbi:DUF159 family protein [Corynebacterium ulcerans]|uniref:SOS response-associated peptidase n=1 Tax=Corynebacterium ulcerans TaxID=65058 RepID=UPI000C77059B|nr:SOS response-associated peptidase [Corynebacterium ulcerans]PLW00098.1 DUF159 family protein [Corynebacterium ulcerans]
MRYMCGRFVLCTTDEQLLQVPGFSVVHAPMGLPAPRYNIAPTQKIAIIRTGDAPGEAVIEPARWGLLPSWKQDDSGTPLFNARAETVAEKPSFRAAFASRRCLIPLDGYYEWHNKQPYWITTGSVVWAAGLWDTGAQQLSATMLTTDSLPPLDRVHHRMPRFLAADELMVWLQGSPGQAARLLSPGDAGAFSLSPADKAVGNIRNDYPELIGLNVDKLPIDE